MHKDSMRNKMDVKMYCAKHKDTELNFSTNSEVGTSSAYEINVKILIHPCAKCQMEIEKIKDAAKILTGLANE